MLELMHLLLQRQTNIGLLTHHIHLFEALKTNKKKKKYNETFIQKDLCKCFMGLRIELKLLLFVKMTTRIV